MSVARITTIFFKSKEGADNTVKSYTTNAPNEFPEAKQLLQVRIDDTTVIEQKELSKWLNKPESDLKSFFGQPDKVEFLKTNRFLDIYIPFEGEKPFLSLIKKFSI